MGGKHQPLLCSLLVMSHLFPYWYVQWYLYIYICVYSRYTQLVIMLESHHTILNPRLCCSSHHLNPFEITSFASENPLKAPFSHGFPVVSTEKPCWPHRGPRAMPSSSRPCRARRRRTAMRGRSAMSDGGRRQRLGCGKRLTNELINVNPGPWINKPLRLFTWGVPFKY